MIELVDPKYMHYLFDLGALIRQYALEVRQSLESGEKGSEAHTLDSGRLLAYYEVITLMQQQALGFDINLEEINLHDFDPDKELVRSL
jgi:hypothetical protein